MRKLGTQLRIYSNTTDPQSAEYNHQQWERTIAKIEDNMNDIRAKYELTPNQIWGITPTQVPGKLLME